MSRSVLKWYTKCLPTTNCKTHLFGYLKKKKIFYYYFIKEQNWIGGSLLKHDLLSIKADYFDFDFKAMWLKK